MFEQQDIFDLQGNGSFNDPKSWLSEDQSSTSSPDHHPQRTLSNNSNGTDSNFDRVLYKNLVEMVPLVESLMDRRSKASFTRRASIVYTKTPSRESYPKKNELKGRKTAQSIPTKKRGDAADNGATRKGASADDFSIFATRTSAEEKDSEALVTLQEQVKNLQKKLLEKDELIKSAETSMSQMTSLRAEINELKRHIVEKDSLIKSVHLQLSDAKIKLADRQAALEKLQWEAEMSNRKAEKLQEDIESMQGEVSSFMLLFEGLTEKGSTTYSVDYDVAPYTIDQLPYIDDMNELEMQQMEEAREAYIAALDAAKENQDEESLAIAMEARLRLESFVLGPKSANSDDASHCLRAPAEVFVQ